MSQIEHLPSLEAREEPGWKRYLGDSILAIVGTLLVTGLIYAFQLYPRIPNISLVYLLVVLTLASTRGLYAAILASVVAFLSFDFFLVPPFYTFTIAKFDEWLALFVFLVTAIITGELASALRKRAEQARRREHETRILYELVRATNSEEDLHRQLSIVARAVVDVFASWGVRDCEILLPDVKSRLAVQGSASQPADQVKLSSDEEATASWVMTQAQTVELHDVSLVPQKSGDYGPRAIVRSTATKEAVRRYIRMIPLKMGQQAIGVLCLFMEDDPRLIALEKSLGMERERSNSQTAFFWTFVDQATAVIERARLRRESLQIELLQRTDALRAALLSSVSHDLRTPLSSIKAAASSLLQEEVQWDDEARRSFALSIESEADRLNRLVANLLDMSRIESGALKPEKEWYPIDELIHDVLGRMQPVLEGRTIHTDLPDDLPPVKLDYLQIDQVLTNLIENALRYTPAGSPIEIGVQAIGDRMIISIADRGPGIPAADRERVFDKFYRVMETQTARTIGSGLGLAVSRGLVEAHGGRIWVENRKGGGAIFRFTLPLEKTEGMSNE
ncbi:MAG TPA: ATP-binding protein [Ktedonobacteraceae bacterium]|nr:ATP-binding protein [Ktedonobacteraceae bacterium]